MTLVFASPQMITAAAAQVAQIGVAVERADLAGPTSGVALAAADEVSAAAAALFAAHAEGYQTVSRLAAAFREAFEQTLAAASNAYVQADAVAAQTLSELNALAAPVPTPVTAALILSESGVPTPSQTYIQDVYTKFVLPNFPSAMPPQGVSIPNGLYPFTGVKDLTLNVSVSRGAVMLHDAIIEQLAALPTGSSLAVLGFSQSAVVSSVVMPMLSAAGIPSSAVNFVLLGNPMNPNGGVFARFSGLVLPSLGFTFSGATPDNLYPTVTYSLEYDGFASFPRYPINLLADLNAVLGIPFVHGEYPHLTQAQIDSAVLLETQGPTQSTYYMIPTEQLPLLRPLRLLPYLGNPLAELLEPNMRVLVNLGYGDPEFSYSTGPANVPTPFGLFPSVSPFKVLDLLNTGTAQGIVAAGHELQVQGLPRLPDNSLSTLSSLLQNAPTVLSATSPSSLFVNAIMAVQDANTAASINFVRSLSTAYGTLLPTADIASEIAFTLPSYGVNLFLKGMIQAVSGQPLEGLMNAIGLPIAAGLGLTSLAGGFELIVLAYALDTILFGTPHPIP